MITDIVEERQSGDSFVVHPSMDVLGDYTYECRALICPEAEGGFSAFALRLPGVVSQGETEEEAFANIVEAFQAVLRCYMDDAGEIPWEDAEIERTKGCKERWILVDV